MKTITIQEEIKDTLPDIRLGILETDVQTTPSSEEVKNIIDSRIKELEKILTPESIREMPAVKANKDAYRKLGKDPNRYRPSSESLLRRVVNGKGLYYINNVVDILNFISISTGFSICGYDYYKIGGSISLGKGAKEEPYEGIGKGDLNIENLPVFRDEKGAFGTPTSDSVRTMVTEDTTRFLMIIIGFGNDARIEETLFDAKELYVRYAGGKNIKINVLTL